MKLRLVIDVPDLPQEAAGKAASHALVRLASAFNFLGCLPMSPVPLWSPDGQIIGRAWIEDEQQEAADGRVPGL